MKKLLFIFVFFYFFLLSNSFAFKNIQEIRIFYSKKVVHIENKIFNKYEDKILACKYEKKFYNKLDDTIKNYINKYPKYAKIFKVLLEFNNYRELQIENKCNKIKFLELIKKAENQNRNNRNNKNNIKILNKDDTKNQNRNNENSKNNIKILNKNDTTNQYDTKNQKNISSIENNIKLRFQIDKIDYDYNGNIKLSNFNENIRLPSVGEIEKMYDDFTIKINNHWIRLKKFHFIKISQNELDYGIDYAKKKYKPDFIFYKKIGSEYKLYIFDKNYVNILDPFDPSRSLDYNINQLSKIGYLYIKDLKYKKINNSDGIIIAGIFNYHDKLYYMVLAGQGQYSIVNKKDFKKYIGIIKNFKKGTIILDQNDKLIIWLKGMKIFYLGKYDMYKNIDLNKLGKILYMTFYIIGKYNLKYDVKNMYDLINFTKQFDGKSLKDAYMWIILNYKYNEKINDMLNEKGMNQKLLSDEVLSNIQLIKNWDIFYSLKNKVGVCQTISDILSLIALFNGQNSDIIIGESKRGYLHQISKINGKYYDPTFDFADRAHLQYFGMSKKEVEKYLYLKDD